MMTRSLITLLCTLGVTALCPAAIADSPSDGSGHYAIYVRGYWNGEGDATVSPTTVSVTATVKAADGQGGQVVISNLPVVNGHFSGTGTVLGVPVRVDGRLEPADPSSKQSVTTNASISLTILGAGHAARVAGGRDALP